MKYAIITEQLGLQVDSFQLDHLEIAIPKGKITAIVGPNGSGKSTLLKIISRLLKQDVGDVRIEAMSTANMQPKDFAQKLAMMPQSKQALPNLTVEELIAYGRSPYQKWFQAKKSEEDQSIIEWAMTVTGTKKHANRMFHTLSGGEQQKVRIALALAQKTDILLLDEPTTYLDIAHQLDVMEMLEEINEKYSITVVMVLHELQQAAAYCDHLIAMKKGAVVAEGEPKQLLTSSFLKDVYQIEAKVIFEDHYPLIVPTKRTGS
ncbi:ABC transporter ATP-binding protein [Halalkalibacterium halodurans]|uniref:ABC transporter ATP-binding protein n=1 Tax=Halalkalibacterium halodurans TaxID=86665 RepID=UPI002E249035|nr:ABC transporter ATP-binding protein [Halalkalibacterium halodurans]